MNKDKIMKKIIVLIIVILMTLTTTVMAKGAGHAGGHASSHSSVHSSSSKSSSGSSSKTISGAKSYTVPKNFTSKYNSSNIKTEKVQEATHYNNYSTSNFFTPNFWTAMWAFQCLHDGTEKVTEQDIAKELEERGYSQEEIQEILKEGEQAKAAEEQDKQDTITGWWILGIGIMAIVVLVIVFILIFKNI